MKIANKDCYGIESVGGADVRRFYKAGDPIPANIQVDPADVRETAPGDPAGPTGTTTVVADPEADYSKWSKDDLEAEVARLGLTDQVTGTGNDGNVLKDDLVAVLEGHQ